MIVSAYLHMYVWLRAQSRVNMQHICAVYLSVFLSFCLSVCLSLYIYMYIETKFNKFPDFFRIGTFIDNTNMKL